MAIQLVLLACCSHTLQRIQRQRLHLKKEENERDFSTLWCQWLIVSFCAAVAVAVSAATDSTADSTAAAIAATGGIVAEA